MKGVRKDAKLKSNRSPSEFRSSAVFYEPRGYSIQDSKV